MIKQRSGPTDLTQTLGLRTTTNKRWDDIRSSNIKVALVGLGLITGLVCGVNKLLENASVAKAKEIDIEATIQKPDLSKEYKMMCRDYMVGNKDISWSHLMNKFFRSSEFKNLYGSTNITYYQYRLTEMSEKVKEINYNRFIEGKRISIPTGRFMSTTELGNKAKNLSDKKGMGDAFRKHGWTEVADCLKEIRYQYGGQGARVVIIESLRGFFPYQNDRELSYKKDIDIITSGVSPNRFLTELKRNSERRNYILYSTSNIE